MSNSFADRRALGVLASLQKLFRVDDWLYSVLPLVCSAPLFYALLGDGGRGLSDGFGLKMGFFSAFVFVFLSFGYMINDYSDMEADLACGKQKVIIFLPDQAVRLILAVLFLAGVVCATVASRNFFLTLLAVCATYFLGAIYSVTFLRVKEEGILGPIVSSFAQRGAPIIVAATLFGMDWVMTFSWVLLSFLNGLRYVLIHQIVDYGNDVRASVKTFVTIYGRMWGKRLVVVVLIVEAALLVPSILIPLVEAYAPAVCFVGLAYLLLSAALVLIYVRVFEKKDLLFTFDLVPFELFLNFVLPLLLASLLAVSNSLCLFAVAAMLVIEVPFLWAKSKPLAFLPFLFRSEHVELPKDV